MAEIEDPTSNAAPTARTRRHRRRWPYWCLAGALAVLTLGVLYLSTAGASFRAPTWLAERVERAVNRQMVGAQLSLSGIDVIVDTRLRPRVQMRNVGVFTPDGTELAMVDQVSARLSPQQLFRGAASMRALSISGAIVTVRRNAEGEFNLFVGGQATGAEGDLASVLDAIDKAFAAEPLSTLGEITADHVTISLEDARSGRLWQVTDGRVALSHNDERVSLRVEADVFNGTEDLASTVIAFDALKGTSRASLSAQFQNALAADIAAQSPVLSFLSVLDAPMSGSLRTTIGADGSIEDLAGTLTIESGALKPTPDTPPIPFEFGQAYMDYDPETQTIALTQLDFESETATLTAEGTALLQDFRGRWPSTLVGQFRVSDVDLQPKGLFAEPMVFDRGAFEFRMRLDPFSVDIGQVSLGPSEQRLLASGRVKAVDTGWSAALDLTLNQISPDRVLSLWPVAVARGARRWISENVISGAVSDLTVALRLAPDRPAKASLSFLFKDAVVQALGFLPPVRGAAGYASFDGKSFTTVIEKGAVEAPQGGAVSVAGSYFKVIDVTAPIEQAEVKLRTSSSVTAALSLLNQEPLAVLDDAGIPVDVADGQAVVRGTLSFPLKQDLSIREVLYRAEGELFNLRSERLVEGRSFASDELSVIADGSEVVISGPATLDGVTVRGSWRQETGPNAVPGSQVVGSLELSQRFLDAFNIALPPGTLRGSGVASMIVDLAPGTAPRFSLASDLNRVALSVPSLDWSKPRNRTGSLEVVGQLGAVPRIDRLALSAPGLSLSGTVDLTATGSLASAEFDRVRVGAWLDAPVTLTGRGARPPAVLVNGGTADLRNTSLNGGGGEGGPLTMRLERVTVSESIVLRQFRGDFAPGRSLEGQFSASLNGIAPIEGSIIPTSVGPAIRVRSDRAGETLAAAGVLRSARGGELALTLTPTGRTGVYNGQLGVKNTRIFKTPALTDLLNAISVIGLVDQLNAGGILLTDVEAEFQLSPDLLTLYFASGIGPSIGVSLDGLYGLNSNRLDMQGVVSPVYFLNGIGQIFSRGRDGLFGFNFRLTGNADDPRVSVNPLSILTPGAFREIFRRPPPAPSQ